MINAMTKCDLRTTSHRTGDDDVKKVKRFHFLSISTQMWVDLIWKKQFIRSLEHREIGHREGRSHDVSYRHHIHHHPVLSHPMTHEVTLRHI